jgi:hypothetical protein
MTGPVYVSIWPLNVAAGVAVLMLAAFLAGITAGWRMDRWLLRLAQQIAAGLLALVLAFLLAAILRYEI